VQWRNFFKFKQPASIYYLDILESCSKSDVIEFNGILRAWNAQNDVLGGLYPGIASLAHFQSQFYAHILSLNVTNEHDLYTVSGLNCSATPISIAWEVQGTSSAPANIDRQATSNGNIWATGNTSATPLMIACYTSRLEISAGRQILTFT
jgi:hypothetical protein